MANRWTDSQLEAITSIGSNILVSAAAGSGKTAVLVERIIRKITDLDNPVSVDRLVVVTFTKAAAAEMKARIRTALDELIEKNPSDHNLIRQQTLVNNAKITTIDSFCLDIVRNYFTETDIDPGFRTADEGEISLMENDVMNNMLEEYYQSGDKDFTSLVESYGTGRDDSKLSDIIFKIYRFARSYPWESEWYDRCLVDNISLNDIPCVKYMWDSILKSLKGYRAKYDEYRAFCESPDGPAVYMENIEQDMMLLDRLIDADTFEEFARRLSVSSFERMKTCRSCPDEEKKTFVKNGRDECKAYVTKTLQAKISSDVEGMKRDIAINASSVAVMVKLARDFSNRCRQEKRERNIIDFNDMEHLALDILVKNDNGKLSYTAVADTLSDYYSEILIDEYQDSNMLQEQILTAVSKNRNQTEPDNMYMVGDVKQSIYRFRMACPELFMDKSRRYCGTHEGKAESKAESEADNKWVAETLGCDVADTDGNCDGSIRENGSVTKGGDAHRNGGVRIQLQNNFRSRSNVLESTNRVFERVMTDEYGGIAYDKDARLYPGADYPECPAYIIRGDEQLTAVSFGEEASTDIHIFEKNGTDLSQAEAEAQILGGIIKELVGVKDGRVHVVADSKAAGGYRPIRYSDIVIISRALKDFAPVVVNSLMNQGIPAFTENSKGFFAVYEIEILMSLLTVIDNPLNDIPMAAVMMSYFGKMTSKDVAQIRSCDKKSRLADILREIAEQQKESSDETSAELSYEADVELGYKAYTELSGESNRAEKESGNDAADSKKQDVKEKYAGMDKKLREKVVRLVSLIDSYRRKSGVSSVYDLLWDVMYSTGFYDYAGTMPSGERRQANLDILLLRAGDFEKTSYRGLFNFLRYIEKLKTYDVDLGEASVLSEKDDIVRVMSIHKSKGLEFPVCIVAGMGKKMSHQDAVGAVITHQTYGIGADVVRLDSRTKSPTIIKNAVAMAIKEEDTSEFMRILYVAMTRAKEKLIMTGHVSSQLDKAMSSWKTVKDSLRVRDMKNASALGTYDYAEIDSCADFLDMVMPVALMSDGTDGDNTFTVTVHENIEEAESVEMTADYEDEAEIGEIPEYPYELKENVKSKVTVSELKSMLHDDDYDDREMLESSVRRALDDNYKEEADARFAEDHAMNVKGVAGKSEGGMVNGEDDVKDSGPRDDRGVPKFMQSGEEKLVGNQRGTAYHRIMEILDYTEFAGAKDDECSADKKDDCCADRNGDEAGADGVTRTSPVDVTDKSAVLTAVNNQMERMLEQKRITAQQRDCVEAGDIAAFVGSVLGRRTIKAARMGTLHREQPFVYIDEAIPDQLVQGVIDMYFEEDGKLVIVDFKTDRVSGRHGREVLAERYRIQLDYYAKALAQVTGMPVAEKLIYAFAIGETVEV